MTVALVAWLLVLALTAKGGLAVQSPTGLVVKQSLSQDGAEITFEWCSPLCPAEYNSSTWPGEAFVFRATLFNATSDTVISSETLSEDGSNPVKFRCRDVGEGRLPFRWTFTGLEPRQEYYLEVQSTAFSGDDAGVYSESIRSITATASPTAKGSGREQYVKSGISTAFTQVPIDDDYHNLADWDPSGRFINWTQIGDEWPVFEKWSIFCRYRMGYHISGNSLEQTLPLDFDGDGREDLFLVSSATSNMLLANNGSGYFFGMRQNFGIDMDFMDANTHSGDKSMHAVAADFNGDGYVDIFVANDGQANEVLINSDEGTRQLSPSSLSLSLDGISPPTET